MYFSLCVRAHFCFSTSKATTFHICKTGAAEQNDARSCYCRGGAASWKCAGQVHARMAGKQHLCRAQQPRRWQKGDAFRSAQDDWIPQLKKKYSLGVPVRGLKTSLLPVWRVGERWRQPVQWARQRAEMWSVLCLVLRISSCVLSCKSAGAVCWTKISTLAPLALTHVRP